MTVLNTNGVFTYTELKAMELGEFFRFLVELRIIDTLQKKEAR